MSRLEVLTVFSDVLVQKQTYELKMYVLSRFKSNIMFSPKVLKLAPWEERILMTLLVKGTRVDPCSFGACAATMNCSFSTS